MALPNELHMAVAEYLMYPDALSLKHTNRHFYELVDTGVELKIDWLVERRKMHLECPNDRGCDLGSDVRFCRGSVAYGWILHALQHGANVLCRLLMKRRREHIECGSRPGIGCIVYGTPKCQHRQRSRSRWRGGVMKAQFTIEVWWMLVGMLPILAYLTWSQFAFSGL